MTLARRSRQTKDPIAASRIPELAARHLVHSSQLSGPLFWREQHLHPPRSPPCHCSHLPGRQCIPHVAESLTPPPCFPAEQYGSSWATPTDQRARAHLEAPERRIDRGSRRNVTSEGVKGKTVSPLERAVADNLCRRRRALLENQRQQRWLNERTSPRNLSWLIPIKTEGCKHRPFPELRIAFTSARALDRPWLALELRVLRLHALAGRRVCTPQASRVGQRPVHGLALTHEVLCAVKRGCRGATLVREDLGTER